MSAADPEPPAAGLRVVAPGLWTTVQDLGRPGHRGLGVPVGGAFDRAALALANALVGNAPGAAALELTLLGGTFEATGPLWLALAGAALDAAVEGHEESRRPLTIPQAFPLAPGARLVIGGARAGARTYLAARGGFAVPTMLGSRSREEPLRAGDVLPARAGSGPVLRPAPALAARFAPRLGMLRLTAGPDAAEVPPSCWDGRAFRVGAQGDRMGVRLEPIDAGADPPAPDPERLSAPVAPGALQWAGAAWILLGVACGTMAGYPHAAQLIAADLARLAQLRPGDRVTLRRVGLETARRIDAAAAARLRRLTLLVRTRARGEVQWVGS